MDDDDKPVCKRGDDADEEELIISISNAVVKPHTVMVKIVNTAVAVSTMFAIVQAVAVTKSAIEKLVVLWIKGNAAIMESIFVEVNHSVSRIYHCSASRTHQHGCSADGK